MKSRDALFAFFALALMLFGMTSLAAGGHYLYGGPALQAQSVGFDALAHQVFDCRTCAAAAIVKDAGAVVVVADKGSVGQ